MRIGVDPDAVGRQLLGQRLHERHAGGAGHRARLAGAARRLGRHGQVKRTDPLAGPQLRQRQAGQPHRGHQLELEVGLPRVVVDRLERTGRGAPGVVHDPVDAAPPRHDRVDEAPRGPRAGSRRPAGASTSPPPPPRLPPRRPQSLLVAAADGDRRPLLGQPSGQRQAQPVRASGDRARPCRPARDPCQLLLRSVACDVERSRPGTPSDLAACERRRTKRRRAQRGSALGVRVAPTVLASAASPSRR